MKVRYIGQSFGVDALTNGKVYECLEADEFGFLRIIDDSGEDYLYSAAHPEAIDEEMEPGRWEVVEDDENGTLQKAIDEAIRILG